MTLIVAVAGADQPGGDIPGWMTWVEPVLRGGGRGLAVFPARTAAGEVVEILDPAPFVTRFVHLDRPREERVEAAGEAGLPPTGRWRIWLEGNWTISPGSSVHVFPPSDRMRHVAPLFLPTVPAGRVLPPRSWNGNSTASLDLWTVHGETTRPGDPSGQLSRRIWIDEGESGVLMPRGRTLAGLWDPSDDTWEALSRPFDVRAGQAAPAPLEQPSEGRAFLLAELAHRLGEPPDEVEQADLYALQSGTRHPPEEWVVAPEVTFALWYDLAPGPVRVAGGGERVYPPPVELELRDGGIGHVRQPLVPRPLLEVTLILPVELRQGALDLAVYRSEDSELLAQVPLGSEQSRQRFHLIHDRVTVELRSKFGTYRQEIDLSREEEASLLLEPEVIRISGEVRSGGEPVAARLRLHTTDGHTVEAMSDEVGRFEAVALRPVFWGAVHLDGLTEPWMESWMPPISEDRHLDLDISQARVTVEVVDATTGLGVPDAQVVVASRYHPKEDLEESENERDDRSGRMMGRTVTTDEEGVATLPPPRPGRLEIQVESVGYEPSGDPVVVTVPDPPADQELVIPLTPLGDGKVVRFLLADGRPAAGAEILAIRGQGRATVPLRTDPEGHVEIPTDAGLSRLLVRHPEAAAEALPWAERVAEQLQWTLPALSGSTLSVRVVEPGGGPPAALATPTIWIGGLPVRGPELAWLLATRPFTDRQGRWRTDRLPARPLRILFTERSPEFEPNTLANLSTEVGPPWPQLLELELVR